MNKKEEMLTVALRLFASEGYENVGIQKIVETVAVTKPTLYHYFGSKNGLLVALLNAYFEPFLAELRQSAVYQRDITLTLERIAKTYFRFADEQPEFYRLALALTYAPAESEASKTLFPYIEQQYKILAEVFEQAERDHGNMCGRSHRYAITFLGMLNSYITTHFYGHIPLNDESAYLACKQYMHGIFS
jgi:AcrR family transcriptional regulator